MRARMRLDHIQVDQQLRDTLGDHRAPVVGVQGQLSGLDALLGTGLANEFLGEFFGFAFGDHPADHVTTVHIQNDIEVVVGPGGGATQFGNIPTPQLVRARRQQFGFGIDRVLQLVAAFANLLIFGQNPIHCTPRAQVALFIQQGGIHFAGCLILKAFAV